MYAVIKTGGKQYRVSEGDFLTIESLPEEVGQKVSFNKVLLVADGEKVTVGAPLVAKAKVTAEVVLHGRHKKVNILKFKRRKHHMKRMGHRQNFTKVKIESIKA